MGDRRPDWAVWGNVPTVELLGAVALSLNIDPREVKHSPDGWMAGVGGGPVLDESPEFKNRLLVASSNLGRNNLLVSVTPRASLESYKHEVYIPLFGYWAKNLGWNLPDPFPVSNESPPTDQAEIERSAINLTEAERDKLLKQIASLALALAEKNNRFKRGDKPNANQIAEAVGAILDVMPDVNKRGISNSSIRESIQDGLALLNK